jgi:hypothetical protein
LSAHAVFGGSLCAKESIVSAVQDLLREAAMGRAGVDRRFVQTILESGPEAAAEVLTFSRLSTNEHRLLLDDLLVDLFRHWGTPEALDYFIGAIRRYPEDVDDQLIQALLPFGERAVEPLLKLYEELGEEEGSDIAFLLAGLRARDPRVLALLLDRLEFDTADGAFCLGLYGDLAARPALERLLAEIPADQSGQPVDVDSTDRESNVELRREIQHALDQLDAPQPHYESEPFDVLAEYPERALPAFDVLTEQERLDLLASPEADVRAGAAASLFNSAISPKAQRVLLEVAKSDPAAEVRGHAWAAVADSTEDDSIRESMLAVLKNPSNPVAERGGAAVGLYPVAERDDVRTGLEALYAEGGSARAKALEAMWRSLWKPYAKYFPEHLEDPNPEVVRQALRGAGYFQLTRYADKIASYFDREAPFENLRDDALFAYALAMPGETTRGRVRGLLRKIDSLTDLSGSELELVEFALDERLKLHGLDPVFAAEEGGEDSLHEMGEASKPAPSPAPAFKAGRNDPCPCGSGKKYKKCHGQ